MARAAGLSGLGAGLAFGPKAPHRRLGQRSISLLLLPGGPICQGAFAVDAGTQQGEKGSANHRMPPRVIHREAA